MASLAALTLPAAADDVYRCDGGTTLTYMDAAREMRVTGYVKHFDVAIPFAMSGGRHATWSIAPPEDVTSCDDSVAPCAEYWAPAEGPAVIYYILDPGHQVDCQPN